MRTTRIFLPAAIAVVLAVGGCSGGGGGADDDVATLGSGDDQSSDESSDDDSSGGGRGGGEIDPEFQDAMVEFAECMREQGIDFPDPEVTGDGGVIIAGPAGGASGGPGGATRPSDAEMEEMEAANEVCQPILEAVEGSMPEIDPEEQQEMQDQALEFAECMREHGIDFPDPQFDADEGGRVRVEMNDSGEGGGIDPNDEDFQDAAEECGEEGGFVGGGFSVSSDDGDDG